MMYPRFLRDWQTVFSRLMRSIPGTAPLIEQLKRSGFYSEGKERYDTNRAFSDRELVRMFCYFLFYQMHGYYTVLDRPQTLSAMGLIRTLDPEFYLEHACDKIAHRLRWWPNPAIRLYRRLFRTSPFTQ